MLHWIGPWIFKKIWLDCVSTRNFVWICSLLLFPCPPTYNLFHEKPTTSHISPKISVQDIIIYARLITYFGNFVFGFSSLRLRDFLYDIFRLQGKMGKTKWKINKLLLNILVTSCQKQPKMKLPKWDETKLKRLHGLQLKSTLN